MTNDERKHEKTSNRGDKRCSYNCKKLYPEEWVTCGCGEPLQYCNVTEQLECPSCGY